MRKFLLALCFSALSCAALADELPVVAGLKALRAPVTKIVAEAGKGQDADFAAVGASYAEVDKAWKLVVGEPLELDRYGIGADRQEAAWRQVRMMGMLVGYLDEAVKRGDRALMLRAAGMLTAAYDNLATTFGTR